MRKKPKICTKCGKEMFEKELAIINCKEVCAKCFKESKEKNRYKRRGNGNTEKGSWLDKYLK